MSKETERAARVAEWTLSGMSSAMYCKGRDFASETLYWSSRRLARRPKNNIGMLLLYLLYAVTALALSCCSKSAEQKLPSPASTPHAVDEAPGVDKQPDKAPNPVSTEAASALVTKWLEAQNRQSFPEYESLYAERFHGVKRAGDVTTSFDRKGWLRDRRSMFAKPFHVTVEGLTIRLVAETAVADLEQTFKSEHYADRGPKQFVMVAENGALKIAREELFRSDRAPGQFQNGVSISDFSFIRQIEERRYWVVEPLSTEGQSVTNAPERVGAAAAFAKLGSPPQLPTQLQNMVGVSIAIDPGMQPPCIVKLSDWGILAELQPHFSARNRWAGLDDEKLTDEQIALEIFGDDARSARDRHFAVDITEASSACQSTRWGRLASLGKVAHSEVEEVTDSDSALLKALQRSLRKTRSYKELERSFKAAEADGSFDELMADSIKVYRTRIGATTFVLTTASFLGDCHGFSGEASQVWRVHGQTPVEMQSVLPLSIKPELALDLNGDGIPEWVSETQMIAWDGRTYSSALDVTPFDYDCPC